LRYYLTSLRLGLHTSISKSLENAAIKAAEVGANAFQIFSASPRMWRASPPAPSAVKLLRRARERHDLASAMGGYLAGRLRTKWHAIHSDEVHFRDTANGFLVWAVAVVMTVAFLTSGGRHVHGRRRFNPRRHFYDSRCAGTGQRVLRRSLIPIRSRQFPRRILIRPRRSRGDSGSFAAWE
jgi:hypothetical protein